VLRHQDNPWRKPCPAHTRDAFEQLQKRLKRNTRPLILDSFCGTGMSTALIAVAHPDALVIGIDQSAHRLAKHQPGDAQNYLLLRAEAEPFWLCLVEAGIALHSHWLLYPNPWPKTSQFKRRVHGHGAFPCYPGWVGRWSSAPTGRFTRKSSLKQPASSASMDKTYPSPPIRQ
jgi:tRNA G46 methylase TrmB